MKTKNDEDENEKKRVRRRVHKGFNVENLPNYTKTFRRLQNKLPFVC